MYIYILIKNGHYHSVHRTYEAAYETIHNQYFDSDFPNEYEILEERI